jgi:hypothetical protein
MRAELNRNLTRIMQRAVGLAKHSAVRATLVAVAVSTVWLCAAHPASAQLRGGDFRPGMSVGPRAFGNVGRFDQTFRNAPSDDGAVVSSEPTAKHTHGKTISNAKRVDTSGVPSANEPHVTDEVVIRMNGNPPTAVADALARKYRLTRLESQYLGSMGVTLYRWRIPNGQTVTAVTTELAAEKGVFSQPNFIFTLQQSVAGEGAEKTQSEGEVSQYALAKLHLSEAHGLAKGDKVLVAVIDSGIDASHRELQGVIAGQFEALRSGDTPPHPHGTEIAGIIAAHGRLIGAAPAVHILDVRAFGTVSSGAEGTTFNIVKGLDWATTQGARIVNMSFAGPSDPLLQRAMAVARQKGAILIAAAGNAGPKSPPLYPAADPNVIAVTATNDQDQLFAMANRGSHIAVAAPGVDILVPTLGDGYQVSSGTSFAAAYVSGVVALILERRPKLLADAAKRILLATAKDLGPKGRDDQFGAGLVDAYQAIMSLEPQSATVSSGPAVR